MRVIVVLVFPLWLAMADASGLLKISREFHETAAKTGGDFYFWAPGEFASSSLQIPIHHEEVLLAYDAVEDKRVFEIPVETGARTLTLFAGVQQKDLIAIVRPDGTAVRHGQSGVALQTFQHMSIATIETPTAGVWKLELHGAGLYSISAHVRPAEDGIVFLSADFVEERGRPGHEGLFPIERSAKRGESLTCRLRLSGPTRNAELTWVGQDGTVMGTARMKPIGDDEYLGSCTAPDKPFRIGATGVDLNERVFQRVERGLREPQ